MKVKALTSEELASFLRAHLQFRSFTLFVPILREPFISLLCSLPESVKRLSSVYLAEEKRRVNDYAVRRLAGCGYRRVFYVPRLHAKMLLTEDFVVVGSANYTERALYNHEVNIVIWGNYGMVPGLVRIVRGIMSSAAPALEHKNAEG